MEAWQATMSLRICRSGEWISDDLSRRNDILQQQWFCRETGEIEWRDVEIVEELYET